MPATRATARTSPLGSARPWMSRRVARARVTWPRATASRRVAGLALTSTMRARPRASTCDRRLIFPVLAHDGVHLILDLQLQLLELLALALLLAGQIVDPVELHD